MFFRILGFSFVFIICLINCFNTVTGQVRLDPLVSTEVGLIRGLIASDGNYSMFLGIPYAKIDETNPFGISKPYPKFENTFDAFDDSTVCSQVEEFKDTIVGSPDCLVLHVYVPSTASSNNRLPVFVWIHGGGFVDGSGNRYLYGPSFLVSQDIIVVSINYRLGPYGFMCLDTPEIPGNQGLKDQLLALRWINKNIEAFGGDASRITICGESAGSMSVELHLHSNNEKLYDKAILQSGTAMGFSISESFTTAPIVLADYLGFFTASIDEALTFLSKVDSHLVIAAVRDLGIEMQFGPCIEKEFEEVESFITQNWKTADLPKIKNLPILIGFNSDESLWRHIFNEDEYYQNLNILENSLASDFDIDADEFTGMKDKVRHFYFGDEEINVETKRNVIDFDSDFTFIHPTYRSIAKYLDNDVDNIYFYLFSYHGERNFFKDFYNYTGATHADELGYLFDISYMKDMVVTPEDEIILNRMITMWANFVKFGNPTPVISDLLQIQWKPITSQSQRPYLNIDSQMSLDSRPFNQRVTFWDLFYKSNKNSRKI